MLTDEQINAAWREVTQESIHDSRERFARAIEAVATAPLQERIAELEAKLAQRVPDVEDLKDRLVAISSAVADSDDREAQAIIRTALQLLAAAPAAPEQQEPTTVTMMKVPDNPATLAQLAAVRPDLIPEICGIAKAPNAQQAEAQPVGGTSLDELSGALMNNAPLNTDQRSALYELLIAAAQPKAVPLTKQMQRLSMEELEAIFQCGGDVYTNVQSALAAKNGMELADASAKKGG